MMCKKTAAEPEKALELFTNGPQPIKSRRRELANELISRG